MDAQEIRSLQEAYEAVYENQQLDEGLRILPRERMSNKAASKRLKAVGTKLKSKFTTAKGTTARNVEDEKSKKLVSQANKIDKVAAKHIPSDVEAKERKNRGGSWNPRNPMGSNEYAERQFAKNRAKLGIKEQVDVYDVILSHLLDEGYAETPEAAEVIMVNMSEEWRQDIMEISQKTATRAYAARATGEYEYDTNPSDQTKSGKYKSDVARGRIEKKFGKKAAKHADRAAHAQIFGRRGMPSAD